MRMECEKTELTAEDWKAMYMILVDGIAKSMGEMPLLPEVSRACEILVKASRDAEDYYIDALRQLLPDKEVSSEK